MEGWYPGDAAANDLVGGNPGTITGGVTFSPGEVAGAFTLDGTGYSDFGNATNLRLASGDFTVDAWVNVAASGTEMSIIDKMNPALSNDGWRLFKQSNNHFEFCLGDGASGCTAGAVASLTAAVASLTAAVPGSWYHVAAVKSGASTELYVNGLLKTR